jgi:hypothetical protein
MSELMFDWGGKETDSTMAAEAARGLLNYCSRKGIDTAKVVLKGSGLRRGELGVFARHDTGAERTLLTIPLARAPGGCCINPFLTCAATAGIPDPLRARDILARFLPAQDPVLPQIVYMACVLGSVRSDVNNEAATWLDAYPHPAHEEPEALLPLYADVLTADEVAQYHEINKMFTASLQRMLLEWKEIDGRGKPPIQLLYWGLRTALRRQGMFPSEWVPARVGSGGHAVVCTTLVPVVDLVAHDSRRPNAYVSILEDEAKPEDPPYLQLRTMSPVKEGEELRSQFKIDPLHARPMTLYRFGHLQF